MLRGRSGRAGCSALAGRCAPRAGPSCSTCALLSVVVRVVLWRRHVVRTAPFRPALMPTSHTRPIQVRSAVCRRARPDARDVGRAAGVLRRSRLVADPLEPLTRLPGVAADADAVREALTPRAQPPREPARLARDRRRGVGPRGAGVGEPRRRLGGAARRGPGHRPRPGRLAAGRRGARRAAGRLALGARPGAGAPARPRRRRPARRHRTTTSAGPASTPASASASTPSRGS